MTFEEWWHGYEKIENVDAARIAWAAATAAERARIVALMRAERQRIADALGPQLTFIDYLTPLAKRIEEGE